MVNTGSEKRITDLEEATAHQTRLTEELNAVVAEQSARIEVLERRVELLLRRAAEQEADGTGGAVFGAEKPPHY